MSAGLEEIAIEPGNTRGWPKNLMQMRWALFVVRDGLSPLAATYQVYGEGTSADQSRKLKKRLRPFLTFLQEKKNEVAEQQFKVSTERVLRESAAIALADKVSYFQKVYIKGVERFIGKPPDELTDMQRIAVESWAAVEIETDEGTMIDYRYKLYDKQASLTFLGKHLGMLSETMLVDMMSRRHQAESRDFSNVPTEKLDKTISALEHALDALKDGNAIEGEVDYPGTDIVPSR